MLSAYLSRLTHHLYKQQCYCETVPRKGSSRVCCQNEVSEHYPFLSFPSFSLPLSFCSLSCTLSFSSTGGKRPLDHPQGISTNTYCTCGFEQLAVFFTVSQSVLDCFLQCDLSLKLPDPSQVVTGIKLLSNNAILT